MRKCENSHHMLTFTVVLYTLCSLSGEDTAFSQDSSSDASMVSVCCATGVLLLYCTPR